MILEKFDLSGKTAIVTGGGTGLGRAMALAMADAGCNIVGAARRRGPLEETRALVVEKGRRFAVIPTDVTDSEQVDSMVGQAIAEFGRVDILINNAGGGGAGGGKTFPELTDEDWREGIDTNLTSAFYCSRAIVPHLLEQGGGRIINITSIFGMRGLGGNFLYSTAKGGIRQLTRALAMTYASANIRCTCIARGRFPFWDTPEDQVGWGRRQPNGRVGRGRRSARWRCSCAPRRRTTCRARRC